MVDMINFFCVVKFFASAPAASRGERRKLKPAEVANLLFLRMAEGKKLLSYLQIFTVGNTPFFAYLSSNIAPKLLLFRLFFAHFRLKLRLECYDLFLACKLLK